jgi:hypothetical protein
MNLLAYIAHNAGRRKLIVGAGWGIIHVRGIEQLSQYSIYVLSTLNLPTQCTVEIKMTRIMYNNIKMINT